MRGWRNLPPALLLGFALELVLQVVSTAVTFTHDPGRDPLRYQVAAAGMDVAITLLYAIGARDIAQRSTGAQRRGANIAAVGWLASLLFSFVWQWIIQVHPPDPSSFETTFRIVNYIFFALAMIAPIGFSIAIWQRNRSFAIAGAGVALLAHPPEFLGKLLYGWFDFGYRGMTLLVSITETMRLIAIFGMAALVAVAATPDTALAAGGLRRAAGALRLRVIAAVVVTGLTLLVMAGKGASAESVMKLAMISGVVINVIAFVLLGLGTLAASRAAIAELPRWALAAGAAMSLWCGGVMLGQLQYMYRLLYGGDRYGGGDIADYAQSLPLAVPLVAMLGVAIVAAMIGTFAGRRGLAELGAEASSKGVVFVALMLASVGIQNWLLDDATSLGGSVMIMLAAAVSGLVAMVIMARLFDHAATAIEGEQPLPTATVVSDRA